MPCCQTATASPAVAATSELQPYLEQTCARLSVQAIKRVELPMGTVFVTQALVFGAGLLGITYGATSASWDPDHEGSALGWQEFRTNFAAIMGKYGKE